MGNICGTKHSDRGPTTDKKKSGKKSMKTKFSSATETVRRSFKRGSKNSSIKKKGKDLRKAEETTQSTELSLDDAKCQHENKEMDSDVEKFVQKDKQSCQIITIAQIHAQISVEDAKTKEEIEVVPTICCDTENQSSNTTENISAREVYTGKKLNHFDFIDQEASAEINIREEISEQSEVDVLKQSVIFQDDNLVKDDNIVLRNVNDEEMTYTHEFKQNQIGEDIQKVLSDIIEEDSQEEKSDQLEIEVEKQNEILQEKNLVDGNDQREMDADLQKSLPERIAEEIQEVKSNESEIYVRKHDESLQGEKIVKDENLVAVNVVGEENIDTDECNTNEKEDDNSENMVQIEADSSNKTEEIVHEEKSVAEEKSDCKIIKENHIPVSRVTCSNVEEKRRSNSVELIDSAASYDGGESQSVDNYVAADYDTVNWWR